MTSSGRRHRGLFALALVAACGQPLPGFAKEAWWNGCFRRVYDAAHLAAHPGQTVKSIAVLKTPQTKYEVWDNYSVWIAHADLTITMRGKKTKYSGNNTDCAAVTAGLDCVMEEDAGRFTLARWGAGVKLVNTSSVNRHLHGSAGGGIRLTGPGEVSDESTGPFLRNSEDWTFVLPPAPAGGCK